MESSYDLVIIGAGPAGLATAIEAQKAGLNYIVLDKGTVANGISHYQREMYFFSTPEMLEIGDIPFIVSTPRPTSLDCVNYYRRVADHYNLRCLFYEPVISVQKTGSEFILASASGSRFNSRYVVLATGYYSSPNPLGVRGENLPHVSHYYTDPLPYYRQDILIVGGKNSAVEAALDLWRHGARVTVIHRGSALSQGIKYWILPDFENRVAAKSITLHLESEVEEFRPGCTIVSMKGGKRIEVRTGFAFILIGYRIDTAFCQSAGLTLGPDTLEPSYNPETMETNVPALFVAGGMVGGRLNNKVFIENGRRHGKAIVSEIIRRKGSGKGKMN